VISGFRRHLHEICVPLGYDAAWSVKFRTDVSGHPVGPIFNSQEVHWLLKMIPIGCP